MSRRTSLRAKISIAFILQIAAISCATVLGVYAAATVLEDVLIKRALRDEAQHYVSRLDQRPDAELPDTFNMHGYLDRGDGGLPDYVAELPPGYHTLPREQGSQLVYVSDTPHGRLVLVFNQEHVHQLALYFGFVPLTVVLLIIYLTAWLSYRLSRRAISPVVWLANEVREWDPKAPNLEALQPENLPVDAEGEVEVLARALHGFGSRIQEFVERERQFTRDASHELRSPLTVIKIAADVLLADGDLTPYAQRSVTRIKKACRDMEALIEAFLILAREGDTGLPEEDFLIGDVVDEEIERAEPLVAGKPVELRANIGHNFALHASPKVVSVMLGNLLRNACLYTDSGTVTVTIGEDYVEVEDTGVGMKPEDVARAFQPFFRASNSQRGGHGVGLTIVRRLSDRFGWPVELHSELGVGTRARIRFPDARPDIG